MSVPLLLTSISFSAVSGTLLTQTKISISVLPDYLLAFAIDKETLKTTGAMKCWSNGVMGRTDRYSRYYPIRQYAITPIYLYRKGHIIPFWQTVGCGPLTR
jgi:hypothetical protein